MHLESFKKFKLLNLYLAEDVFNIDAITGGFNFHNAWTGGWMVSESILNSARD